jgi:hypothetical protein
MIILQESASVQTISFIPRDSDIDTIVIHDEETNTIETYRTADRVYELISRISDDEGTFEAKNCLISTFEMTDTYIYASSYFYNYDMILNLKQNRFYTITFLKGDVVKYKDKIFCTNQDTVTFSVNKDVYKSNATTNEFIVYE